MTYKRILLKLSGEALGGETGVGISPQAVHGRLIRARRKIAEDLRLNGLIRRKI